MHDLDNHAFIKACENEGLLIDEHEVAVDDKSVVTRIYKYSGDTYVHILVNGETMGFKQILVAHHEF